MPLCGSKRKLTSFTGKDQLLTVLRAGNFGDESPFGNGGPSGLSVLETAHQSEAGANLFEIERLFYVFPVGEAITITAGPNVAQDDMLAVMPTFYLSDPILDIFAANGAPGAYNKNQGAGVGISWTAGNGLSASANYVAANGAISNSAEGGFATDHAAGWFVRSCEGFNR